MSAQKVVTRTSAQKTSTPPITRTSAQQPLTRASAQKTTTPLHTLTIEQLIETYQQETNHTKRQAIHVAIDVWLAKHAKWSLQNVRPDVQQLPTFQPADQVFRVPTQKNIPVMDEDTDRAVHMVETFLSHPDLKITIPSQGIAHYQLGDIVCLFVAATPQQPILPLTPKGERLIEHVLGRVKHLRKLLSYQLDDNVTADIHNQHAALDQIEEFLTKVDNTTLNEYSTSFAAFWMLKYENRLFIMSCLGGAVKRKFPEHPLTHQVMDLDESRHILYDAHVSFAANVEAFLDPEVIAQIQTYKKQPRHPFSIAGSCTWLMSMLMHCVQTRLSPVLDGPDVWGTVVTLENAASRAGCKCYSTAASSQNMLTFMTPKGSIEKFLRVLLTGRMLSQSHTIPVEGRMTLHHPIWRIVPSSCIPQNTQSLRGKTSRTFDWLGQLQSTHVGTMPLMIFIEPQLAYTLYRYGQRIRKYIPRNS